MATTVCTVCGCKILEGPTVSCPRCDTPHHTDCWNYNGGCGIFACNPNTKAVLVAKPGVAAAPSSNRALIMVVAGLTLGLVGLHALRTVNPPVAVPPVVVATQPQPANSAGEAPWVGYKAPDFAIRDLEGKVQKFSEIRNGRAAVLSFWLAHCPDCMPHVPAWAELYKRYKEDDKLVLVNVAAFANDAASTKQFASQHGIGGRILMDGQSQAVPLYQLGTITTFVIDKDGTIRYREGQAGTNLQQVAPVIERVLSR